MKCMKKLVVFGAAFFDVIKLIEAIKRKEPTWQILGFLDDNQELQNSTLGDYPVLGTRKLIPKLVKEQVYFFNNVSRDTSLLKQIGDLLDSSGCQAATLTHPLLDLHHVQLGHGCILPEGCIVGGNTKIGNYVITRLGVLISHDVTIEDHVFIGPGSVIGGGAVLKKGCHIGAGAIIMSQRTVGEKSVVGAGALVTREVEPGTTVVGVPAKTLESKK